MNSISYSVMGAPPSESGIFHDKSQWFGPQSSILGFPGGLGSSVQNNLDSNYSQDYRS